MIRTRPAPVRIALAVALAAGVVALMAPGRAWWLLPALLAGGASPFLEWTRVPPRLERLLPRVSAVVLLVALVLGWLGRVAGTMAGTLGPVSSVAGGLLAMLAAAFSLAPSAFPAGQTLAPAAIGLLAVAGLDPEPEGFGGSRLPFLQSPDRNGFADVYLVLAVVSAVALWAAALLGAGPRWRRDAVLAMAATLVVALGLAGAGIAGLPAAQPHVEKAVAGALSEGTTGLSGDSTLGEFATLAVSRRRVLDLNAGPSASGEHWLLRSQVFTRFDGRRWSNPPDKRPLEVLKQVGAPPSGSRLLTDLGRWFEPSPSGASAIGIVVSGHTIEIRITQHVTDRWPLLLPRGVASVTVETPVVRRDRFDLLHPPWPVRLYGAVVSSAPNASSPSPATLPPSNPDLAAGLVLPPAVDPRVRALADDLARPSPSARERLARTVAHLQAGYRYTLEPGVFRSPDPVAEFLFEKKAAYCEYFASAAAVLLRLQGVPARFVKGLSVGVQNDYGGGLHVVRESDAHAWIEAWIPGEGWVEADPTPAGQFALAHGRPGRLAEVVERLRAVLAEAWARLRGPGPLAFLRFLGRRLRDLLAHEVRQPWVLGVVVVIVLGPRLLGRARAILRRRRARALAAAAVPTDLRDLVDQLERQWRRAGRPRPSGRGLLEHAQALAAEAGAPAPPRRPAPPVGLVEAGPPIVEAYYRARFGGEPPPADELRRLAEGLAH